ncbi:hypothetical protein [Actinomadura sp. GTD37]|uniref:SMODS domain-containing nucleotidyltransferase n=1 Tax=Actinomadura sp. GTD37 TaxID=1778030 RepID=UPI0035BFB474
MATTINGGFTTLTSWLIPTTAQKDALSTHRNTVKAKLNSALAVTNFFGTGSSSNGTDVRSRSDVDFFAGIPSQNQRDSSDRMLVVVKEVLQQRFSSTNIFVRSPAVVCAFGTDASEKLEVVPAYYTGQSSDGFNIYKIPNGSGGWMRSSPKVHNSYVTEVNDDLSKKVKPLIRLMKAIKYYNNIPISSFYLELRVTKWISEDTSVHYAYDVHAMLKNLVDCELAQMVDPKGISGYVAAASTETYRQDALSKLTTARNRSAWARHYEGEDKIEKAFEYWDKVFNGGFPAYG